MVELNVNGEVVTISVDRIVNAGYSGRDEGAVQDHINELVEDGVDVPDSVPTTYKLAPNTLLVDPGTVQVVGKDTSGEAGVRATGRR
jgi:hypothetical protein